LYIDATPTIAAPTAARSAEQEGSAQVFGRAIAAEEQRKMIPTPQVAALKRIAMDRLLD
jgi:hypothetical protein